MSYENKWFKGVWAHKRGWQSFWAQHLAQISNFQIFIFMFVFENKDFLFQTNCFWSVAELQICYSLQEWGVGEGQSKMGTLNLKLEGLSSLLFHLLPGWSWVTHLTSFFLNFLVNKMRAIYIYIYIILTWEYILIDFRVRERHQSVASFMHPN